MRATINREPQSSQNMGLIAKVRKSSASRGHGASLACRQSRLTFPRNTLI